MPSRIAHPNFFKNNLQAQCMDVWCKAFCCIQIYFKTVLQNASEHAIFIQKIEKNFADGPYPLPRSHLNGKGRPLSTHLLGAFGAQPLAPFAKCLYVLRDWILLCDGVLRSILLKNTLYTSSMGSHVLIKCWVVFA